MPFDIAGAKQAGYTDTEILKYLAPEIKFDTEGARKAGYNDAEILGFIGQKVGKPAQPAPRPEDVGLFESLVGSGRRGLTSLGDIPTGYSVAGTTAFGSEEALRKKMAEAKTEQKKEAARETAPGMRVADFQRIYEDKGVLEAAKQVPRYIAQNIIESGPQMAGPLLAAKGATAISAPLIGPFAPVAGAVAGIATYGLQQFGNLMLRQAQERNDPEEMSIAKAALVSGAMAPFGYLMDRWTLGLGTLGAKKAASEVAKELAARKVAGEMVGIGVAAEIAKQAAKGSAIGFIAEAPVEVLEQVGERWQAGLDLTGDKANAEYLDALFGAGAAGFGMGAASRGVRAYGDYAKSVEEQTPAVTTPSASTTQAAGIPPSNPTPAPPADGSPEQRNALIASYRTDLGLPLDVATAMVDEQIAAIQSAAQPPTPAATTATTVPPAPAATDIPAAPAPPTPAATDIPAGVDPQRLEQIEIEYVNAGFSVKEAKAKALTDVLQEVKAASATETLGMGVEVIAKLRQMVEDPSVDRSTISALREAYQKETGKIAPPEMVQSVWYEKRKKEQEAPSATVPTDGTAPSGGGVAAALQQQSGASAEGITDAQSGGVDGAQPVVTQSATREGAQPGALVPRQAAVSFDGRKGIVFNEAVLGGLRRVVVDDYVALDNPSRVGAVMLTGIDRQAGGSAGRASEVLTALTNWADITNERIILSPAASGDLKQPELVKWYERNGFTTTPDGLMERNPPTTEQTTGEGAQPGALKTEETPPSDPITLINQYASQTGAERRATYAQLRNKSPEELQSAIQTLQAERQKLLSKDGKRPAKNSEKAKLWDDLTDKEDLITTVWGDVTQAAPTETITPAAPTPAAKPITPTSFAVKEVPAAESPTGKRVWNVTGPDGEILGTFAKKGDATVRATQARATVRTAAGQQPAGRKATLTPEQKAAATGQRAVTQKASIDATRTAEKLKQQIGAKFEPSPNATAESVADEQTQYQANRIDVLTQAYGIATNPAHRLNTAGKTAKTVLDDPSVTAREREMAQNRGKSEKPQSSGIPLGVTSQNSNPKYTTFKNAGQALSWVSRNGTKFEKFLAKRLYYFARKAQIVIASDMNALPEAVRKAFETGSAGVYFKNVIYLHPVYGINNTVFLHEALHGATIAKINEYLTRRQNGESVPQSMQDAYLALETVRRIASERYFLLKDAGTLDDRMLVFEKGGAFSDLKEFIAYGLSSEDMHEFLLQTPGLFAGKTANYFNNLLSNFVKGIRGLFKMDDTHQSAMQDLILATDNLLSTRMQVRKTATAPPSPALPPSTPVKKLKQKVAKVSKAMAQAQASSNAADVENGISTGMAGRMAEDWLPLLKDRYAAFNVGTIQQLLYKLPTSDIIRWKGDEVPGLKRVDTLVQRMAAMRGTMQLAGAKKATELAKFVRKNGQKVIGEAMHLARLNEVSPTKYANRADALANDSNIKENAANSVDPKYSAAQQREYKKKVKERTRAINEVFTAWEALGKQPGGHSMYKMVRQFYIDSYNLTRTLLNSQIQALPIDAAAKAKLMKSVRLMHEQGQNNLPEEYFPFMRYGENWLRVAAKGGGLAGRAFYTFESGADRNTFQRQEAARLGKNPEDASVFSKGSDLTSLRKDFANESVMLKEMFSAIDKATTSSTISSAADVDAFKDGLKDQLYQVYLLTLPERSLRKQFLNAKNITGFSANIFRNFKTSATKLANQASKLRYATEIQNEVIAARKSLAGRPPSEVEKLSLFVNEIAYRANDELNPTPRSKLAAAASQFAFVTILTSAASAMVQFASIPVMVMPRLNRDYGYGKSAAKFARYMPIWNTVGVTTTEPNGDVTYSAPSIGTSKMVTSDPVLQRAFEEAVNRQVTTVGNVSIITNNKRTPENTRKSAVGAAAESAYGLITGLFSGTERLTREMTYMMAFELEYAKTKDFDASVEKAIEVTQDTLLRYDTMERPRILRTEVGSVVGQFKMYAAGMTSFLIRNMYNSMRVTNPKEALPAIHLLSGVLLTGAVFHGLAGSPFYSTIATLIDLILNFGDEDEEKKKRREKNPLTAQSSDLRFRYEFLPEQFGEIRMPGIDGREYKLSTVLEKGLVSVLTDVNVGSRTSFNNMWFRSAPEGKDLKETVFNIAEANLGPSVSAGGSFISGVEDLTNGKIRRGLEKMVPAFFKGSIVASRYADEGAQTRDRKVILERNELSGLNLAAQVLGFTPTRLAEIQEYNYNKKQVIDTAKKEKNKLLKDFKDLENNPDRTPEARKKLDRRIDQHNRRYNFTEELTIDEETLERSLDAYEERGEKTIRGLYSSDELRFYLDKTDPYLRQKR